MLSHSPMIVTDGLVLCLDAANRRSYPGSGTSWLDLSGQGNNGTLTNGPTFDSNNGGIINFDGTNDGFNTSKTASEIGVSETSMSLFMFIKRATPSLNSSQGYAGFKGGSSHITIMSTTNFFVDIYDTNGVRAPGIVMLDGATTFYEKWINIGFTIDNGLVKGYGNGKFYNSRTVNNIASISSVVFTITGGYGYYKYQGSIGNCFLYNRPLTADEVRRNYLATKSRFGL